MELIERLFRRELRGIGLDPSRDVCLVSTATVEEKVARSLLAAVFGGRVNVRAVPRSTRKRANVFTPSSLEHELTEELRAFLEDVERKPKLPRLMASIPEEMILVYAEKRGLRGKTLAPRDDVRQLLEELQRGQPQTKAALRKSFAAIRAATAREGKSL